MESRPGVPERNSSSSRIIGGLRKGPFPTPKLRHRHAVPQKIIVNLDEAASLPKTTFPWQNPGEDIGDEGEKVISRYGINQISIATNARRTPRPLSLRCHRPRRSLSKSSPSSTSVAAEERSVERLPTDRLHR